MESNGGRVRGIISRDLGPARSCGAPDDSIGPAMGRHVGRSPCSHGCSFCLLFVVE
jgi:hypothetical protein